MADIDTGTATAGSKIAAAANAGALWGMFAACLLAVVAFAKTILSPFFNKAESAIESKLRQPAEPRRGQQAKTGTKPKSKAEQAYRQKLADLEAQRELDEAEEEVERARERALKRAKRAQRTRSTGQGISRTQTV